MQLNPYLFFDGRCAEAFRFYERSLGGKITMMITHAEAPMAEPAAPEWRDKIVHARLEVKGNLLMGSDAPPPNYEASKGYSISIMVEEPIEAERIFNALKENGTVRMPLQETFWAVRFGMLIDQFGI